MHGRFVFLLSFFTCVGYSGIAQSDTLSLDDTAYKIFEKVDVEAAFPGGNDAWARFLEKNLRAETPVNRGAPAGYYTVIIQFVVDREGNVSDMRALTKHGFGMEEEVLRVLVKSPKWKPAEQGGRFVKAYRKQPVIFYIEEEKKKKKNKDN